MVLNKVSLPFSVRLLGDDLGNLLERPGKVLEAKVETISGRLITLLIGDQRLEALLSAEVSAKALKPGRFVRLKVLTKGPPAVLSLIHVPPEEGTKGPAEVIKQLFMLLTAPKNAVSSNLVPSEKSFLPPLVLKALVDISSSKPGKGLKEQGKTQGNRPEGPLTLLTRLWEAGVFFLPFSFPDSISWATLEEDHSEDSTGGRSFRLRLFLSRLGALEVIFSLFQDKLHVRIYTAQNDTLSLIKDHIPHLYQGLRLCYPEVKLDLGLMETPPGSLLVREG